jgi:hypothetical protein
MIQIQGFDRVLGYTGVLGFGNHIMENSLILDKLVKSVQIGIAQIAAYVKLGISPIAPYQGYPNLAGDIGDIS